MTTKDKLRLLVDYLNGVKDVSFDISHWKRDTSCGTVCCAVGHATNIPEFQDAGLRLGVALGYSTTVAPIYNGQIGFQACQQFFGLKNIGDAYWLFDGKSYEDDGLDGSREDVIGRIEKYIANGCQRTKEI